MVFARNNPHFGSFFFVYFALAFLVSNTLAGAAEKVRLTPNTHVGSLLRVKTVVEVAGSLHVDASAGDDPISIPLEVDAEMFFDELGIADEHHASIRHYWAAKADFKVNEKNDHRELRQDRRLIQLSSGSVANDRFTSPHGPLSRDELELIDVATNAFPVERLLPGNLVEANTTWTHDDAVIAELLRIESVDNGEVNSKITDISAEIVKIGLAGTVEGQVDGVTTNIELVGTYHFDRTNKIVKWIALAIKEKRDIGFSAPGFELVARIRTARQRVDKSDALRASEIGKLNLQPSESAKLLDFVSEDELFQIAFDRRWYLLSQRNSSTLLRMVERGDLLATCKIDQLTKSVPGKQVTLDGFRGDVQRALDKNCKEIISASESINSQNMRVLRVVAAGEVKETPIRWIYYHLSNDEGYRLSFIFTYDASLESRFAGMDETMTSSVKILPQKEERQARAITVGQ